MTKLYRETLEMVLELCKGLSIKDAGDHMVMCANDFAVDGDLARARMILSMVTDFYYEHCMTEQTLTNGCLREAVASLVELFGVTDFRLLRDRGLKA